MTFYYPVRMTSKSRFTVVAVPRFRTVTRLLILVNKKSRKFYLKRQENNFTIFSEEYKEWKQEYGIFDDK